MEGLERVELVYDDFISRGVDRKRLTCLLFSELSEVFLPSRCSASSDGLDDVCLTNALLIWGSWWLAVVSECDLAIAEAGLWKESLT